MKVVAGWRDAFHVSSNHLDLVPVVARLAADADLAGLQQRDIATADEKAAGKTSSNWVLVATGRDDLALGADHDDWRRLGDGAGAPLWTDSFSDVVSVLKF